MFIPNVNIASYRQQYERSNVEQVNLIVCNENVHTPRLIGLQRAYIGGVEDEGARYRGYGANSKRCNYHNIYNPIYYNCKKGYKGNMDWYINDAMR